MQSETHLIQLSKTPEASEFPIEKLDGPITPNKLFFIRSHYETPILDAFHWRLVLTGCVEHSLELSLTDLQAMPKVSIETVLECAGNGRSALATPVPGLQWGAGAVGNAVWSGVAVKTILELAGLADRAVDVVFEGADKGEIESPHAPRGEVAYSRSVPIRVALSENAILAYEMNGVPLHPSHGFPVRLIVAGWYGAASVKWLTRITAIDHPFGGYYQTADYSYWEVNDGLTELKPIGAMPVKSVIARPTNGSKVHVGDCLEICGAAWSGEGFITKVEVSLDDGSTWLAADLAELSSLRSWRLWSFQWLVEGPLGKRTIVVRATDSLGQIQPLVRDGKCQSYIIDHSVPVEIDVLSESIN